MSNYPNENGLEKFFNTGALCVVLDRQDTIALVVRPFHNCQPFVVAVNHRPGETSWGHGHYFSHLDNALECFTQKIGSRETDTEGFAEFNPRWTPEGSYNE